MFYRPLRLGAFALCSLISLGAPHASAQAPAVDPTSVEGKRVEGKARYERGVEAYSAGRYKDAIDLFLQADALAPSAALSFNIARAYEKIGDDAACLQWYRDFRRRAPDAKNGPEVDQRIHALEGVLAKKGVQQVTILSRPLGATVIVDEQPVGVTPYTGQLAPGPHRVALSLRGYADSAQKLELAADRAQDLEVTLVPAAERPAQPTGTEPSTLVGQGPVAPASSGPADRPAGAKFGIWPWIGMGTGAAALVGGLGFELARRRTEKDADADLTQVGFKQKLDREHSQQTTARVLATVGGALLVTGATLLVVDLTSRTKGSGAPPKLGLLCAPGACGLDVRGAF